VLEFLLDPSLMPAGVTFQNLDIWRNGTQVPACNNGTTQAAPDPCVASRTAYPAPSGGGADIVVRTSEASLWQFGSSSNDTVPPVVTVPSDMTVLQTSPKGTPVVFTASALDDVDGPVPVTCTPPSTSTFPVGTTMVTCTATDSAGNKGSASFTVTVLRPGQARIVLTVPHHLRVEATGPDGAVVAYTVTVVDPLGTATVTCTPPSGSLFPLGRTQVMCTATDASGQHAARRFDVRVVDTTPPVIAGVPDDITADSTKHDAVVTYTLPTATDLVDGTVPVRCHPPSGARLHEGVTEVECEARDSSHNRATASFTVTVNGPADRHGPPPPPPGKVGH
jgi:hypothetical protein